MTRRIMARQFTSDKPTAGSKNLKQAKWNF